MPTISFHHAHMPSASFAEHIAAGARMCPSEASVEQRLVKRSDESAFPVRNLCGLSVRPPDSVRMVAASGSFNHMGPPSSFTVTQ